MQLRRATLSDVPLLKRWNNSAHVIAAIGSDRIWDWQRLIDSDPAEREVVIAEVDGRAIGMIQVIDPAREEDHYWGEVEDNLRAIDIWLSESSDVGHGLGTQMMRLALQRSFAHPHVRAVVVDPLSSNARAHRFYQRLGFRAVERRLFGTDDCIVFRIDRADWERPSPR